jgi:hypothetical protein
MFRYAAFKIILRKADIICAISTFEDVNVWNFGSPGLICNPVRKPIVVRDGPLGLLTMKGFLSMAQMPS